MIVIEIFNAGCSRDTVRTSPPSSRSIRHELRSAVERGNAVLDCLGLPRRTAGPLSAKRHHPRHSGSSYTAFRAPTVQTHATAGIGPAENKKSGEHCSRLKLPSRSNLHSASPLPAVSFLGGFQTPAGSRR